MMGGKTAMPKRRLRSPEKVARRRAAREMAMAAYGIKGNV